MNRHKYDTRYKKHCILCGKLLLRYEKWYDGHRNEPGDLAERHSCVRTSDGYRCVSCEELNNDKARILTREICKICYHVNPIGFSVPQEVWSAVNPFGENDSVICLPCFVRIADEKMIQWDKDIQFFPVSLKTHLEECKHGE